MKLQITKKNRSFSENNNLDIKSEKANYIGVISISILAFAFGIGWYIPGGIFSELESAFIKNDVTSANVVLSLTIYIIGLMVGAPLTAICFYKFNRKNIIIAFAIIFIISNILIAFSVDWSELLFFRFTSGIAHGALISIGTLIAASMVPKNKRGLAIAIFYSSLFSATFTVVPLFTWWSSISSVSANFLEQNWRWSFFTTGLIAFIALIFVLFFIPKNLMLNNKRNLKKEFKSLLFWPFLLNMLFCVCIFLCIFVIYPLLQEEWVSDQYGIIANDKSLLAILLLVYGICSFFGNQVGGFFADGKMFPAIYLIVLGFITDIVLLIVCCIFKNPLGILICTLILPIIAYMILPNLYAIGFSLAKYRSREETVDFESGITGFMIGCGGLIGTVISGPITTVNNEYYAPNFLIIIYIVLGLLCFCFLLLIPINWYMHVTKLNHTKSKFLKNIFDNFPMIVDKYTTQEVYEYINQRRSVNTKQKVIDTTKKFKKLENKNGKRS